MHNKIIKLTAAVLFMSALFSCGGDGELNNSTSSNSTQKDLKVYGFVLDKNEVGIKDVGLILSTKGETIEQVNTDENGAYTFFNLPTGSYEILIIPPSDSYEYDGEKVRFTYLADSDLKMRDIVLRKTNLQWGELS